LIDDVTKHNADLWNTRAPNRCSPNQSFINE
jgi:hypothetical protein